MGYWESRQFVSLGESETRASYGKEGIRHNCGKTEERIGRRKKESTVQLQTARLQGLCYPGIMCDVGTKRLRLFEFQNDSHES